MPRAERRLNSSSAFLVSKHPSWHGVIMFGSAENLKKLLQFIFPVSTKKIDEMFYLLLRRSGLKTILKVS